MRTHHPFIFGLDFPSEPTIEKLDGYISRVMSHASEISSGLLGSHDLDDFLGINWSGSDLHFMESLEEFMKVVIPQAYRAPQFSPEPPVFDSEKVKRKSLVDHNYRLSSGRHLCSRDSL